MASREVRARSFGAIAADYDRYRPAAPVEAVEWAVPAGAADVLDVAAGTGSVTRRVRDRVAGIVVGVEPDARMRAVLAARSAGVEAVGAVGESLPFASGAFDAVVVASAWHWLDPARAVPEIARVLRPGGVLAVLYNSPDRQVPWVADLLGSRPKGTVPGRQVELPPGAPWSRPETTVISWSLDATHADLVGLASTYSGVITEPDAERADRLDRVATLAPESAVLPMDCRCWRSTVL